VTPLAIVFVSFTGLMKVLAKESQGDRHFQGKPKKGTAFVKEQSNLGMYPP
jgi:hypothetical protein